MSNEIKAAAIERITDLSRVELLGYFEKFTPAVFRAQFAEIESKQTDCDAFYKSVLAHMQMTMEKMKRDDPTAYLISYIFALKDLTDYPVKPNFYLARAFGIDLEKLNNTEVAFLQSEEIDYKISHGLFWGFDKTPEELSEKAALCMGDIYQIGDANKLDAINSLLAETEAYLLYLNEKQGEDWVSRKATLERFKKILSDTTKKPEKTLEDFYYDFNAKKSTIADNPDPHSSSFLRAVAYTLVSCLTLGLFNVARMGYRAYSGKEYVGFSKMFSGEKFAGNVEAKVRLPSSASPQR
ncbi:MAG: hypothetical protein ACHQAX_04325 [Gammaproteobacteria bacterium]